MPSSPGESACGNRQQLLTATQGEEGRETHHLAKAVQRLRCVEPPELDLKKLDPVRLDEVLVAENGLDLGARRGRDKLARLDG